MAIGNPISLTNNIAEKTSSVTATAEQTQFTVPGGYFINKLGVYRNGAKLSQSIDYTANDGVTVTLTVPSNSGDVVQFQVFDYFNIADAITTEGGTVAGTLTVEGSIVANGGVTGAAATFTGDVSIGGTLTYEDVTNIDSVGIITARSDISIADKIVHTGDTDTAIRFPSNNTFTVETAGSERVRVSSAGSFGIGTNNPADELHVQGDARIQGSTPILTFQPTGDTQQGRINFTNTADVFKGRVSYNYSDDSMQFWVNASERMRIDSSGNVGIGTDTPAETLSVAGNVRVENSADASQYLNITYQGIDFQNTGAGSSTSATSHLLDDYEEGTWTPVFKGGTTAGTYTYTNQIGRYTKIGNTVTVHASLEDINTVSGGTGSTLIGGLPFTSSTDTVFAQGVARLDDFNIPTDTCDVNATTISNSTDLVIIVTRDSLVAAALPLVTDKLSNTADVYVSCTYRSA